MANAGTPEAVRFENPAPRPAPRRLRLQISSEPGSAPHPPYEDQRSDNDKHPLNQWVLLKQCQDEIGENKEHPEKNEDQDNNCNPSGDFQSQVHGYGSLPLILRLIGKESKTINGR